MIQTTLQLPSLIATIISDTTDTTDHIALVSFLKGQDYVHTAGYQVVGDCAR